MTALTSFAYTEGTSSLPVAPAQCSRKYLLSRVEVGLASYNIFKGKDYHPPKKIKKKSQNEIKKINKKKPQPNKKSSILVVSKLLFQPSVLPKGKSDAHQSLFQL